MKRTSEMHSSVFWASTAPLNGGLLAMGSLMFGFEHEPPPPSDDPTNASDASAVIRFWCDAGPDRWFAKDPEFDQRFRKRFLGLHEAAARRELVGWHATPEGMLALLLLLDQFPRNAFRDTPRMYATDAIARTFAVVAVANGLDRAIDPALRQFVYLPFGHSELLADQERSVNLARELGEPTLSHAIHHRDIVRRFGRFPHRNRILGRQSSPEELHYLENGGFQG
jgi:uncharacterized protein (DUF924 family)